VGGTEDLSKIALLISASLLIFILVAIRVSVVAID
jgi:hypothetical protein